MKDKLNLKSLQDFLFKEIDPATLGILRMVVGVTFLVQLDRLQGYVVEVLPQCSFFLTYDLFHWVTIMPEPQMALLFNVLRVAAVLVTLGVAYRSAMTVLFLGWTYVFLLCNGHYNNHYYLLSLITFLMIFISADKYLSVNRLIWHWHNRRKTPLGGKIGAWLTRQYKERDVVAHWQLFILKAQLFIVYFYGGLAKLNKDWLNGYPMKIWLPGKQVPFFSDWLYTEAAAYFVSYTGVVLDLSVGFLLFSKKTRIWTLPFLFGFHISNHFLFNIGVFPWFMIAATLIFFDPDLPERVWQKLKNLVSSPKKMDKKKKSKAQSTVSVLSGGEWKRKLALGFVVVYLLIQVVYPFRQYLYPGHVGWHGYGNDFAWRMMLIDRVYASRVLVAVPGEGTIGGVDLGKYMTQRQIKSMGHKASHYVRFAHFLRDEMKENGLRGEPEITAYVFRSYNGRPFQPMIDTTANLVTLENRPWRIPSCQVPMQDLPYKTNPDELTPEERDVFGF